VGGLLLLFIVNKSELESSCLLAVTAESRQLLILNRSNNLFNRVCSCLKIILYTTVLLSLLVWALISSACAREYGLLRECTSCEDHTTTC
jgi:hypothetical protein